MTKGVSLPHLPQLDGLRAIAILIVFLAHCGLEYIVPGGFGVTIFFFLSGYLITSLLRSEGAQTGRIDLTGFYVRRTLRIWPSLYLTMAFVALATSVMQVPRDRPIDPFGVLAQLGFVTNYAYLWGHADGVPFMPLWSLAVEEHFYLIFPVLFAIWLKRLPPARAALWCAIGCGIILGIRYWCAATVADISTIYYWSHTRIDSILFGCCLALWHNPAMDQDAWRPRFWHVAVALGTLLLSLVIRNEWFRETLRYSLQGGALFVLFSAVLSSRGIVARLLSSRPMRLIGLYSYTIYLCHVLFVTLLRWTLPGLPVAAVIAIAGAGSMAYSALMYRLVEAPFARWRRALHRTDAQTSLMTIRPGHGP